MRTNLTRARIERGLTQRALAERAGCSQSSLAKWECGASVPPGDVLLRLATILRRSPAHLLTDDGMRRTPRPRRSRAATPAEVSP